MACSKYLKKPFKFGSLTLPNNIFYSPLAGCSDYPFRLLSARYRPGLIYCEMVKMEALVRYDRGTFHLLDYDKNMHPIGAQLVGSNPKIAGKAAKILEELGFDVIDLNCGCPVDKVTKDGSGSGLLKQPELIGELLSEIVAAVSIPVTVKIRAGWDEDSIIAVETTQIAEAAGAQAIAIHGRTRKQGYSGPANWDYIRDAKLAAKTIMVIGNGDVMSGPAAEELFKRTGCDIALASRGTMGRPWIAEEIVSYLEGESVPETTLEYSRDALIEHFEQILFYRSDKKATLDARRIGCWYLKKAQGTRDFRHHISRANSPQEALRLMKEFNVSPS